MWSTGADAVVVGAYYIEINVDNSAGLESSETSYHRARGCITRITPIERTRRHSNAARTLDNAYFP